MADTRRVPVTINKHAEETLAMLRDKYPHLGSDSLLLGQALQEWRLSQEQGSGRGALLRTSLDVATETLTRVKTLEEQIEKLQAELKEAS